MKITNKDAFNALLKGIKGAQFVVEKAGEGAAEALSVAEAKVKTAISKEEDK